MTCPSYSLHVKSGHTDLLRTLIQNSKMTLKKTTYDYCKTDEINCHTHEHKL